MVVQTLEFYEIWENSGKKFNRLYQKTITDKTIYVTIKNKTAGKYDLTIQIGGSGTPETEEISLIDNHYLSIFVGFDVETKNYEKVINFTKGSIFPNGKILYDVNPSYQHYCLNMYYENNSENDLNLEINSKLSNLYITENSSNKSTTLNFNNYVNNLHLQKGNINIGQHTQHDFFMELPDISTIETANTEGENYIYNMDVTKDVILDVDEKSYTYTNDNNQSVTVKKKILAIGKNHATDATTSTEKKNLDDCKFIMNGKMKFKQSSQQSNDQTNFDIFIGCTSYYTDYYRFALKILKRDNNNFTTDDTTNKPETYKKHLTWFNKVNVEVSSDLSSTRATSCTLYIGCNLLRYKEVKEADVSKFKNCEDLYIKNIGIELSGVYGYSMYCGIIAKDIVTNRQNGVYDIATNYGNGKKVNNQTWIENIDFADSFCSKFMIGGLGYSSNWFNNNYNDIIYGDIKIDNITSTKTGNYSENNLNEFIIMSNLKMNKNLNKCIKNNEIQFSNLNHVNIQFNKIDFTNSKFYQELWILHAFQTIKGKEINVTNVKGTSKNNEIHFPSLVPENNEITFNFKDTKESKVGERQKSERQNIYVSNIHDFNGFNMIYSLWYNKYNFMIQRLNLTTTKYLKSGSTTTVLKETLSGIKIYTTASTVLKLSYQNNVPSILHSFEKDEKGKNKFSDDEIFEISVEILSNWEKIKFIFDVTPEVDPTPDQPIPLPIPSPKQKINIFKVLKILTLIYLLSDDDQEFIDIVFLLILRYYNTIKEIFYNCSEKYTAYINYIIQLYLLSNGLTYQRSTIVY